MERVAGIGISPVSKPETLQTEPTTESYWSLIALHSSHTQRNGDVHSTRAQSQANIIWKKTGWEEPKWQMAFGDGLPLAGACKSPHSASPAPSTFAFSNRALWTASADYRFRFRSWNVINEWTVLFAATNWIDVIQRSETKCHSQIVWHADVDGNGYEAFEHRFGVIRPGVEGTHTNVGAYRPVSTVRGWQFITDNKTILRKITLIKYHHKWFVIPTPTIDPHFEN